MLLVGSAALIMNGIPLTRKTGDIDVIGTQAELDELQAGGFTPVTGRAFRMHDWPNIIVDFEVAQSGSSAAAYLALGREVVNDTVKLCGHDINLASLPVLYSLKRSHRHSPKAWHKHIADYHMLRRACLYDDELEEITLQREDEMTIKTPSLNKSVKDFFDDNVSNRVFIHDEIHEVMAYYDRPLYERIRKSPDKVACSLVKWNGLPAFERQQCVLEEAYVIALERAVIPMMFSGGPRVDPARALYWAFMRICTTLCSGWFREYATDNYQAIESGADMQYHEKFFAAVDAGRIKRIATKG